MTHRQKQILIGVAVSCIAVASGGFGYYYGFLPFDNSATADNATDVRNAGEQDSVTPRTFEAVLVRQSAGYERLRSFSGTVRTAFRTGACFQRDGFITRIFVDEGQAVTDGQPLAELDRRHLEAQYATLDARNDQARALLMELRQGPRPETIAAALSVVEDLTQQHQASTLRLERGESLLQSNSISQQDYEQLLYETRALAARLKTSQSQLDELNAGSRAESIEAQESLSRSIESELQAIRYQLDDCTMTAPFTGIVVSRMLDPGAVVSAGTPVLEIIDPRHLEIHIGVPAGIAERVHVGQSFAMRIGSSEVSATLRTVLPELESLTQTRRAVFDLLIEPDKVPVIVDGQLAQIEMPDFVSEPGFWIPATAITSDHRGLWSCLTLEPFGDALWRHQNSDGETAETIQGTATKQSLEILHQVDNKLYVRGTLKDGQILISTGIHRLVSGQAISARISRNPDSTENDQPAFTSQVPGSPQ